MPSGFWSKKPYGRIFTPKIAVEFLRGHILQSNSSMSPCIPKPLSLPVDSVEPSNIDDVNIDMDLMLHTQNVRNFSLIFALIIGINSRG